MTSSPSRVIPITLTLAAVAVLSAGCSTTPSSPAPTSTSSQDGSSAAPVAPDDRGGSDVEAAWLAGGASIGLVTWGSSSADCQPRQAEATADGQTVQVTLTDASDESTACTADLAPRATAFPVPDGVDVTKDVEVRVTYGELKADADLDALDAAPGGADQDHQSSAGWFDDDGIVLLTYGSSTCPPVPQQVLQSKDQISVSFAVVDRECTMDLAPRATVIQLSEEAEGDGPFTLTLTGDNLDATIPVIGRP